MFSLSLISPFSFSKNESKTPTPFFFGRLLSGERGGREEVGRRKWFRFSRPQHAYPNRIWTECRL